jgi:N,N-dimethylformamidase
MSTELRSTTLMGYADRTTMRPGDTISFLVSAKGHSTYQADIVRLLSAEGGPLAPPFREEVIPLVGAGERPGRVQAIDAGSWAHVPLTRDWANGITIQTFIWPTLPNAGAQFIAGTWSEITRIGIGLRIAQDGYLEAVIGDGARVEVVRGEKLKRRHWYFVAASYDSATGTLQLVQESADRVVQSAVQPVARSSQIGALRPSESTAVTFAAVASAGPRPNRRPPVRVAQHFNGKLDRPRLAQRSLSFAEMTALTALEVPVALEPDIAGSWDFALDMGSEIIRDRSPRRADGRLYNMPTRAMTGHNWYGQEMNWQTAPDLYGAIHFHEDDVHDCGWQVDFSVNLPDNLKSGVYAARLRAGEDQYHIPFFVRAPAGRPSSPVAFLAATATYSVYANLKARLMRDFWEVSQGCLLTMDPVDNYLFTHPEIGLSTYDRHSDGSGVAYVSRLRPQTSIRPDARLWNFPADMLVADWLEHSGHGYDVVTDDDLHEEGVAALDDYRVVVTGSHPEYFSSEMLDALQAFLRRGGRLIYTGANGFYWRCAFHPQAPGVIELRRAEDGLRAWDAEPGEYYHSSNGEYGGLWRRNGRTPQMLTGVGFVAQGFDASAPYRRLEDSKDPRAAFIFEGVQNDVFGDAGAMGGGAAGMEIDAADFDLGTPEHTLILARSEGHSNAYQLVNEEITIAHSATDVLHNPAVRAEITFCETAAGGAVFCTGSIAYAGALAINHFNNDCSRILANVLRRFVDPVPFALPGAIGK